MAPPPVQQPEPAEPTGVPVAKSELVEESMRDLDRLDAPSDAGWPTCRIVLRDKGISRSNQTIASAVRQRKIRLSETAL